MAVTAQAGSSVRKKTAFAFSVWLSGSLSFAG